MEIIFFSVQILLVTIRALIGTVILLHAKKNGLKNLYILSMYFYAEAINYSINTVYGFPSIVIGAISNIILVLFISTSLFKEKKNPVWIILLLLIPTIITQLIFGGIYYSGINTDLLMLAGVEISGGVALIMTHGSITFVLVGPYRKIRLNEFVEPRIKARYLLIIISEFSYALVGVLYPFFKLDQNQPVLQTLMSIFIFLTIISQSLAWIQPKGLKKWLNRNYSPEAEMSMLSEEEIMKSFKEG